MVRPTSAGSADRRAVARQHAERIQFATSSGLDNEENMAEFVKEFDWPDTMVHAIDKNGELWTHFGVRFRGTWIMINQDGRVLSRSVGHISKEELAKRLEQVLAE